MIAAMVAPMGLSQFISDGWIDTQYGYDCRTDTSIIFRPNGRYEDIDQSGEWRSNGREIIVTVHNRDYGFVVRPINRNYAIFRDRSGREVQMKRCVIQK